VTGSGRSLLSSHHHPEGQHDDDDRDELQ